jgi:RsiW-degrading membrane proteinase PrsW (M82 family)
VQSFANRVADLAGVDRLEGFSLRELLSASFRRYRLEEIEAHFAVGNAKDTPALAEIEPGWPKPWMFVRLLAGTAVVFAGFFVMLLFWHNAKLLPALIVVGSFAVPMATLIFFFELNSPRNVSLYLVLRSVLLGGLVSIACALFLFGLTRGVSWVGPPLAGVVEEIAKLATVYALTFHLDAKRYPYVLNGMLFGAAVGTGFAAFESAGYAFEVMLSGLFDPARQGVDVLGGSLNIVVRGLLAPFGHIVWTALVAGALWRVKLDQPLKLGMLFHLRVLRALATVMLLHAIWNTGWLHAPFFLKEWLLGFIAWVLAFSMLQTGLKQIKAAQQSDDAAAPQLSGATAVLRRAGPIGMGSRAK